MVDSSKSIGDYNYDKFLGEGSFGKVILIHFNTFIGIQRLSEVNWRSSCNKMYGYV